MGGAENKEVVPPDASALFDGPSKFHDDFKFTVEANHLMSPILAADDLLKQLPPVKILVSKFYEHFFDFHNDPYCFP